MPLFQKSVEKKYLNELDQAIINIKYQAFQDYFGNPERQENIRNSKEEQFQEGFLRELFVNILGYTLNPEPNFNLLTEFKNIVNSKKADGAILKGQDAIAVIELKSTDTTDLDSIETQAFGYKNHHPKCVYVITSNFEKLRFYIQNAVDHIDFDLFRLTKEQFSLLWLCLAKDNLLKDLPLKIKESSVLQEENITKKLYSDYSKFREAIYNNLVKNNIGSENINHALNRGVNPSVLPANDEMNQRVNPLVPDKLTLFKKTQKLLDRFLFIFFAEDRLLLPPNSISEIVKQWTTLKEELDEYVPLYDRFKKYFGYMNTGFKGKKYDIYPYNGGLFAPDELLDSVNIDDEILYEHTLKLSSYDFETDVDVNILGHIFEHSLGEIENVQAEIANSGVNPAVAQTKRKKDGIFYTPKYITKYIVENTVGKLCKEKRNELDIVEEEYAKGRKNRKKDTIKALDEKLNDYRKWMLSLTILDPACGSGAFLNQALDFLIEEHRKIDELRAQLFGGSIVFSDITTDILEKNIFGVDLNEESVEIAKLSLWLRTAQKGRKLNTLTNNIKCGNSLIDDPKVAGEKAFNWQNEFPGIFKKKDKKAWHVTFCLYASRAAYIRADGFTHQFSKEPGYIAPTYPELSEREQEILSEELAKAVGEYQLNILEVNICHDHVHAIIVCEEGELSSLVGKWKGRAAFTYNRRVNPSVEDKPAMYADGTKEKFWAKGFHPELINSNEQLQNTINYIKNNRNKHQLPAATDGLTRQLEAMRCNKEHAFRPEYKGGFDVVIGNPPYVQLQSMGEMSDILSRCDYETFDKGADLYCLFTERGYKLLKEGGMQSFIMPNKWMLVAYGRPLRKFLSKTGLQQILNFGDIQFFQEATTYVCIFVTQKANLKKNIQVLSLNQKTYNGDFITEVSANVYDYPMSKFNESEWSIYIQPTGEPIG